MAMIDSKYFKAYREQLGFTNQQTAKAFFGAKDITPTVDYNYISLLNDRLKEIISKTNGIVVNEIKIKDLDKFFKDNIDNVFTKLKQNNIITKLNNQGRRPEEVYFSWMRGYIISNYFLKSLSLIFNIDINKIDFIGDDDFQNIETFKRTPKADLQLNIDALAKIRIEVQSGFQGVNDIKQHKVLEAKRYNDCISLVIHFDLFNGQVAFVRTDNIEDDNINWITRQQLEGQTVFNIDQNYFVWKLTENPPLFNELNLI